MGSLVWYASDGIAMAHRLLDILQNKIISEAQIMQRVAAGGAHIQH
jgi:hypothetical protein